MKEINKYGLLIVLVMLCLIFGIANPVFLSASNILNILNQVSILGIIAFGMTLVILIGGIDLSVGSIVAFAGIVLAKCLFAGVPVPLCFLICLLSGGALGMINGLLVTFGKVPAFIATLGVMSAARGLALFISDGRAFSNFPASISYISNFEILYVPFPVILFALIFILSFVFLKRTYWGHFILAIGGNEKAAWLSGINVKSYKLLVYILSGVAAAVGSIILVSKLNSAQPQAGVMYELDTIAAVVIGGASLSGGKGSIIGTLLGSLILGVMQNGLSILNVPTYYQQIMIGLIIISAVIIDKKQLNNLKNEK